MKKRLRIALLLGIAATACTSIIGVPDLTYEEATDAGPVGQLDANVTRPDTGSGSSSGGNVDSGKDGGATDATVACDPAKLSTDPSNCGYCGHVCKDTPSCSAGVCTPTLVTRVSGAHWSYSAEVGDYLYATATAASDDGVGGLWRIPKNGADAGTNQRIATNVDLDDFVIVGDTVYFLVYNYYDLDFSDFGGLFACNLKNISSCASPTLIAGFDNPGAITAYLSKAYTTTYNEGAIVSFPVDAGADASATVAAEDSTTAEDAYGLFVDGTDIYYLTQLYQKAGLLQIPPGGTTGSLISSYKSDNATPGQLRGNKTDLYYTAFDNTTGTGGIVNQVARVGGGICPLGGANDVFRPRGLFIDTERVYWTNIGDYDFSKGTVMSCTIGSCCTKADPIGVASAPNTVVADTDYVYWFAAHTGEVFKLRK
jgi:hypothetical protein